MRKCSNLELNHGLFYLQNIPFTSTPPQSMTIKLNMAGVLNWYTNNVHIGTV